MTTMRSRQPNMFLIVADSLRADHLSCYGYHRHTTPRLDAMARTGTLYAAAISPGTWAPASHASLFTGLAPAQHGVSKADPELDPGLTTLPEALRARGYRTYGISSSYWLSTATGFDRGFDVFVQGWQRCQSRRNLPLERQRRRDPNYSPASMTAPARERLRTTINRMDAACRRSARRILAVDKGAHRVNRTVRGWARDWPSSGQPIFGFINYIEPHLPYAAPVAFRQRHLGEREDRRARSVNQQPLKLLGGKTRMDPDDFEILGRLYDAEVTYTDHRIGELMDCLQANGLLEHSIVAVTSGHGENLGDHGLMGHMFSLHDSIVRVPLIVRYPRGQHRGVETGLVQTHDLFPTLVGLAEVDTAAGNGRASRGTEQWLPPFGSARPFAVSEVTHVPPPAAHIARRYPGFDSRAYGRTLRGLRTATHKYVRDSDGAEALYCLVPDPGETTDRAHAEPQQTAALRERLDAWEGMSAPASPRTDGIVAACRPQQEFLSPHTG